MENITLQEFALNRCTNPKTPNDFKYLLDRANGQYDQTLRNMYKRATRAQFEIGDRFALDFIGRDWGEWQPTIEVVSKEKNKYTFREIDREWPRPEYTPYIYDFTAEPQWDDEYGRYTMKVEVNREYISWPPNVIRTGTHNEHPKLIPIS
jgi:hypothetical protein